MNDFSAPDRRRRDILCGLVLISLAILPFVTVWPRQFVNWDDRSNVVENGPVRHPTLTNAGYVFSHAIGANYVPLTWLSHTLDWQIWGDDAWGHAATNALLHAACCCLVVACLRRGGLDPRPSWFAGVLFAVHPVHAEPVAWISGRKDLLCAAALLACQFSYTGWRSTARRSSWIVSAVWLIVAALGKPAAMSAVVSLGLYDLVWLRRSWRDAARSLVPHAAICLSVAAVAVFAQRSGSAFASGTDSRWGAVDLVACSLLLELWRCWVPIPFSPFLPNSMVEGLPSALRWLAPVALVAASLVVALRASRGRFWRAAAWWWFGSLAFLFPVSGVIPLGYTSLADRYLYLPSLGPCVFIAVGLSRLAQRRSDNPRKQLPLPLGEGRGEGAYHASPENRPHPSPPPKGEGEDTPVAQWPTLATTLTAIVLLFLAFVTHNRAAAWKNSFSLWQTTLAAFPKSKIAWRNLSSAYFQENRLEEAARTAENGLKSLPDELNLAINAAVVLTDLGRFTQAEEVLSAAEEGHPQAAEVANQKGILALRQGQIEKARALFELASSQRPEWDLPQLNLSYAFDQLHDLPRALDAARRAIQRAQKDPDPSHRLVDLLLKDGQVAEALAALEQMTAAFPYDAGGWQSRIGLLRQMGRAAEANEVARIAARYVSPERLRF
jgi:tetratricopeptide (TPR) repeat protein